ncbi:acyl--CoA ligase [Aspergillus thermomutatus]|uniref:Acetyl-CoA synthetase-like protein n=1 Tax=Aspergillus thermomutatus TaxID=41047 RepID=A0A397GZ53_ASPTH|nr:uncharacterized protein CDV56_107100 [Aspergillus thermomutatus]RHZ56282.1 hypothetical protein CDV56_107100 [Aspergillus thermomutatus]
MVTYSPYPDVVIPKTDLWSFLFQRETQSIPDSHVVLIDAATGRSYTFADVRKLSLKFGQSLQRKWNWKKGEVLTVISPNAVNLPPIIWGALSIGATVSPLNPNFPAKDLVHYLKDSGSKAVVTQKAQYAVVLEAAQKAGLNADRIIVIDDTKQDMWQSDPSLVSDDEFRRPHIPLIVNPEKEVAFLVYSSGTTGLPKGVMLSHYNIVANILQAEAVDDGVLGHRDTALAFLPFFHIMGLSFLINYSFYIGMSSVVMSGFDLEQVCAAIQKYKVTYGYVVPPVILQLVQNPIATKYDLSSMRMLKSAAAPLPLELINALRTKFSIYVRQGYGMSECSPCTHMQTWQEGREFPGAVGKLLPNMQAKYVPIDGETVRSDKEGELWVKGPNVFLGYLNNPKATEESFSDGWYKTGDVGYEDAHGHFIITDRVKELIKYNGFQIPPAELEGILLGHPAIADVAVVGVPSGQAGSELPRAYVRTKSRELVTERTAREIVEFVKKNVVYYKQLRGGVHFIDEIPRNPSGKILRRELKKRFASKL